MNDPRKNINFDVDENNGFFSKGKVLWEKSEKDVWAEIEQKIESNASSAKVKLYPNVVFSAVAAVFVLLLGISAVFFFYSKTVNTLPGEHLVVELPDNSKVELNAGSTLKYYPLKWRFERKLRLQGEGFFEVEKGEKFEVISGSGTTKVVGTSFNIYARNKKYRVTCISGKVEVALKSKRSVLLNPDNHVEVVNGKLLLHKNYKTELAVSWKNNRFFFAGSPLQEVIDEIERQYAVTIQLQPELKSRNYTSNFSKKYNVEEVLSFVCKTMNITFIKQSDNKFLVVEKS